MDLTERIDELANIKREPSRLLISQDIYDELCRDYSVGEYPMHIRMFCSNNGDLEVEIVNGKGVMDIQ